MAFYLRHISRYRSTIDKIARRYDKYGGRTYTISEPLTITDHSVQSARIMAKRSRNEPIAVTAALLHDFGHVARGKPIDPANGKDDRHELIAANTLKNMEFPWIVYEPIKQHVNAKRFLACDDTYHSNLSKGSQLSLKLQGGPMKSLQEEIAFCKHPLFDEIIELRDVDDNAKDPNITTEPTGIREFQYQIMEVLAMRDIEKHDKKIIKSWFPENGDAQHYRIKAMRVLHPNYLEIIHGIKF